MNEYERHYRRLKTEVEALKNFAMDDIRAKMMMHDIFAKQTDARPLTSRRFPTCTSTSS